jgi:methylglutaconyl-CoA hydratase
LLHQVVDATVLDETVEKHIALLLQGGPLAQAAAKQLVHDAQNKPAQELPDHTAKLLAKLRGSPEGKEGLTAFLENRKPEWAK